MLYAVVKQMEIPDIKNDYFGALKVLETFKTKKEAERYQKGFDGFKVLPVPVPGEAY